MQSKPTSPMRKTEIKEKIETSEMMESEQGKDMAASLHLSFSGEGGMNNSQAGNVNRRPGQERFYTGKIFNATSSES